MRRQNWFRFCTAMFVLGALTASAVANPNITNVVELNGVNTGDSIPAKWTGQTFTPTDSTHLAPGMTLGVPYTVGYFGFAPGAPTHVTPNVVDRKHSYADGPTGGGALVQSFADTQFYPVFGPNIPSYLLGGEYIMAANNNRGVANYQLNVSIAQDSMVYLLVDNRMNGLGNENLKPGPFDATHMGWALAAGFTPVQTGQNHSGLISQFSTATRAAGDPSLPDEVAFDQNSDGFNDNLMNYFSVYSKFYSAGTFSLFQADNPGRNMYGVVVQAVPEPATVSMMFLATSIGAFCLRRRGR